MTLSKMIKNAGMLCYMLLFCFHGYAQDSPLKIGIAGLSHSHVHGLLSGMERKDIEIVGIVETDKALAKRYSEHYGYPMTLVYDTLEQMILEVKPEVVTAFGSIFDHKQIVEVCAPKGVHVMVEKPLAVSLKHAESMEKLAKKHQIKLLTNYETTWYPTNHKAYQLLKENTIGELRKVIVRDGHKGPKKIGVNKEFLNWLTDPTLNGGGAITDFGCYGANLLTWLMDGAKPNTVTAITQQLQAENNPKVDDEAIILLTYDHGNAIIQPSWNWPIGRKDMEIYGVEGVIYADNKYDLRVRYSKGYDGFEQESHRLEDRPKPYHDPFSFLKAVIRDDMQLPPYDLSSLENNMIVMEILDAAIKSASSNKTVVIK
ncbi:Gfo/Idh/MocA family protein [Aestuariivivens sediminicola]|uniref:Gfo/Idh/MocA family protein n=1 Tax=Aestuariivivens sediminicola TaxID=2913560 RepID=UPI001F580EF0|nr:Gfo/Idh/MocA family oxidoreductase [Aestuariivivens sediminicola]